ncbi:MAG TPA: hypothetical protein DIT07_10160, partial [Sphingobacteriaceae bacterium]|nr:hypothetical protein [Sphingobacteriaceae bacterium]
IIITGAPPVTIKQDSIEYRVSDLKLKPGAVVEDAIKRLDGAEVDKDGNVTASGKAVTKIKIDGKEVFGGDMKTITKNIPADAIDKIQLIDDYGDQANFTGVKDGTPETIINITTKPGQNKGVIANGTVGAGNDDRYQLGLFASQFEGDRTLGVTANLNNNNTQIGGGGFGGRGGAGGNFGGGAGGINTGTSTTPSGINTVSSIGLNYNDKWSPKLTVTAAYFFNNGQKDIASNSFSEAAFTTDALGTTKTLFTDGTSNQLNNTYSHNFNARLQFNLNPSNQLLVMPFFSYSNSATNTTSKTLQSGLIKQDQLINSGNTSSTPSFGTNVLYNHLFGKAGRNYSVNLSVRNGDQNSDQTNNNHITYYDAANPTAGSIKDVQNNVINTITNQTLSATARLVYSEPLSKTSRLQFSYNVNYNNYDNNKVSSIADPATGLFHNVDSLGNVFQYSFTSQQAGLNYNFKDKNNDFSIGGTVNPTELSGYSATLGTSINRSNLYLSPILRYRYTYSRTKGIMVNYFGRASEPQFAQLQPVRDVSNPQRSIVGNPDLNSSFTHNIFANYNTSNPAKHTSFMLMLQGNLVKDQIVNNIVLVPDALGALKQEVHYANSDGTYSYSGLYNWQKSFQNRQYTVKVNGGAAYNNAVSLANDIANYSKRWTFSQRLGLQINPGNWMELTPSLAYSYANTNYTLPTNADTKIQTYSLDVDGRLLFLKSKSLILGFTGSKSFNSGYTGALNTDPLVINTYVEKQFMKSKAATVRFQAFDLLNQSNYITRNLTDNGFTDLSTNRLTQYFMLTLTMKINKFAGGTQRSTQPETGGPGFGGGFPGGGR